MVLTRLVLNPNDQAARRDVANPYEMHSTLMRLVDAGSSKPLWRLELGPRSYSDPTVLVQTEEVPNGEALTGASQTYLREFSSRPNILLERMKTGDSLYFRLRANPTVTREGKRHGLERTENQLAWLERQLTRVGAHLIGAQTSQTGKERFVRRRSQDPIVVMGVTYDGSLQVTDPEALRSAVSNGIGHAKALGFGLLTLSR